MSLKQQAVTILILIDGFLQYKHGYSYTDSYRSHNPYFNRWFSAINLQKCIQISNTVTILILIDGFLQYFMTTKTTTSVLMSQSLF